VSEAADRWRRIEEICDTALTHPPTDRPAFLSRACGDDVGIRPEIDAILENLLRVELFLEQPISAIAAQVVEPSPDAMLTGSRLNSFVIECLIGAGGMGQVYRARDTELNRDVAVKVLAPEFVDDADRLVRFAREARVLASLNHPNIAHIHGVQSSGVLTAIVMELVEGETLAARIARGPIAIREALPIARQITEALEAAHDGGVIHRDLKPANIQVRPDGTVKVLDFGLAKTLDHSSQDTEGPMNSALSSLPGVALGTAAYMAPEQVGRKPLDRRVDIWALGCVLFEMLTARPAFAGPSLPEVLVKIVEGEPDWQVLPPSTPGAIRRLLRRCLAKEAKRRLDSAAVARLEIDEAERQLSAANGTVSTRPHAKWLPALPALLGALVTLLVMIVVDKAQPSEQPRPSIVTSLTADGLNLGQPGVHFSLAPTGRTIVYSATFGGEPVLLRRDLDRLDPEPITGVCCASDIFFSDDGRRIGFETRSELWSTALDGSTPQLLQANYPLRGGTWGERDRIVVGRVGSGLWMTSSATGESRQLTHPKAGERHELPQLLPGGRGVLFTIVPAKTPPRAALFLLASGETRDLFEGTGARFVDSGHVVFGRQGKLWAVGFDSRSLQTRGVARPVRDDVLWSAAGYPQFTINGDALAFVRTSRTSTTLGTSVVTLVNRKGVAEMLPLPPGNYLLGAVSPAGDRFVIQVGANRDLWTYDFKRGTFTKLTSDRIVAYAAPTWTPDGSRVVFTTWFDGEVGLGSVAADGGGAVETLVRGVGMRSFERTHPSLLPDGSGAIMTGLAPAASVEDLLMVRLGSEARIETLVQEPGVERNPAVAPNGRLVAYNSDESGRPEVYVRLLPNVSARRWQVSTGGGAAPRWTRGGRELVYRDDQGRMMSVRVLGDAVASVDFSKPESLFTFGAGMRIGIDRGFDVSSDGERFLFFGEPIVPGSPPSAELVVIQNWVDELKRLVRQ
jgi:eukaryotic-like serine/threonine-protein kinase